MWPFRKKRKDDDEVFDDEMRLAAEVSKYPLLTAQEKNELEMLLQQAEKPDLGPGEGYHAEVVAFLQRKGVTVRNWKEAQRIAQAMLWAPTEPG